MAVPLVVAGCVGAPPPLDRGYLSEDQLVDLMRHPKKWDRSTVRVWIFPYDNGFTSSYVVCFEACDGQYADRSPFVIFTRAGRFAGYKGDRPALVTARYSSACAYKPGESWRCVHEHFGEFTEIEDGPPRNGRSGDGSDRD